MEIKIGNEYQNGNEQNEINTENEQSCGKCPA